MNIEIPISGQPANGGNNVPPVQPQNPPVQPTSPPNPTPNPSQGGTPPQQPPQPTPPPNQPNGGSNTQPMDSELLRYKYGAPEVDQNRLVADARREMQQRGVVVIPGSQNMNTFLQQYGQQIRTNESEIIKNKYNYSRQLLEDERNEGLRGVEEWKSDEIKKIAQLNPNLSQEDLEKLFNQKYGTEYREKKAEIYGDYESASKEIDEEEKVELKNVDKELVNAIKDLTRYFQQEARGVVNENSLLNQLKKEHEQAIFERDNAEDEETAREAAARANALRDRIKDIQSEGEEEDEPKKKDYGARILQMIGSVSQFSSGMMNKNIGGMVTGLGSVVTNILPLSDENQASAMKWLSTAGVVGSVMQQQLERENAMSGLAALLRGTNSQRNARDSMYDILSKMHEYNAVNADLPSIFDLGMDESSFAKSAERRISQSGIGGAKGLQQAYYQEALERGLSLQSGSLGAAGIYDRYGVNATDAISNLTSMLIRARNSGVYQGEYARMEEYLRLQQGIMQNQLSFAGTPSYDYANEMISRFANMEGYTVDQRTGSDIQALQNMVLNPGNDRQKAILYSVVEEMAPQTRGRMDLIERYIQDPKNMAKVQQAYIRRIQEMYGSTNTEMGYYAAKAALPGIGQAERLDDVWNGMQNSKYDILKSDEEKFKYIIDIKDYVNGVSEKLTEFSDKITSTVNKIFDKISSL